MSKKSLQTEQIMNEILLLSDIANDRYIECGEKYLHQKIWWGGYRNALNDIKDYIDDLIDEKL